MSLIKLRDEFENCNSKSEYVGALFGSLLGIIIILAPVTAAIVLISVKFRWIGLVLSIPVVIGTIFTIFEVLSAVSLWRAKSDDSSNMALRSVVFVKLVELGAFIGSLVILYRFLFK